MPFFEDEFLWVVMSSYGFLWFTFVARAYPLYSFYTLLLILPTDCAFPAPQNKVPPWDVHKYASLVAPICIVLSQNERPIISWFLSCIIRANFRRTRFLKRSLLWVNEHFKNEYNDKVALLGSSNYLRAVFASIHSVAWGTRKRRSRGISLPVVLHIP